MAKSDNLSDSPGTETCILSRASVWSGSESKSESGRESLGKQSVADRGAASARSARHEREIAGREREYDERKKE